MQEIFMRPHFRINPVTLCHNADQGLLCQRSVCSVAEHWQTGLMTRPQPWLPELQPQVFVEMSEELAKLRGIANGEWVMVSSARGKLECTAIVSKRFRPFKIAGSTVHQVGIPWHFGWRWPESGTGDLSVSKEESANLLTPPAGNPNSNRHAY